MRGAEAFHRARAHDADGDLQTARRCYREAAEEGHRAGAVALGNLLAGDAVAGAEEVADLWFRSSWSPGPAETWWRRGIEGLDADSARELGELLDWDPELVETEHGLRMAYGAGDAHAGYWLASLLEERGSRHDYRYVHDDDDGWLREAGKLVDDVWLRTRRAATAVGRRYGSWWYPGWRLRRDLSSGRVPWGVDAHALHTHVYALARRCRHRGDERPLPAGYLRRRLERDHDGGDVEATFLLGLLAKENRVESWFRSAADAGHRQATFELGRIRLNAGDREGAVHWFRPAAEAGHTGASLALALAWCATDRPAAEAECRKAARGGNLRAAAVLRIMERDPAGSEQTADGSRDSRVTELLATWDEVSSLAPNPDRCVDYLSERSGLPRADIARTRKVRNQCAHPAERGWPTPYELDIALTTARALRTHTAG